MTGSLSIKVLSQFIHYAIAIILCLFLISLFKLIIRDVENIASIASVETFLKEKNYYTTKYEIEKYDSTLKAIRLEESNYKLYLDTEIKNREQEKESYEIWLETVKTLKNLPTNNPLSFSQKINSLYSSYSMERSIRRKLDSIQVAIYDLTYRLESLRKTLKKKQKLANKLYDNHVKEHGFKSFGLRVLLVSPILALGIYFVIRKRKHKLWPIYMGFSLFSLYTFFFGLMPYLPKYGGYVRYTVGIVLTISIGYYALKSIWSYYQRKKNEIHLETKERAKLISPELAEKALKNNQCPSCGKNFLVTDWEKVPANIKAQHYKQASKYCAYCNLLLFSDCQRCQSKQFAYHPFCTSCGEKSPLVTTFT